jgi:cell division initiation protein
MRKDDKIVGEILGEEHAVTPSDVFAKQFKRSRFGGYDRQDVDDFLERIADALENLIIQVRVLKEKNEEQRKAMSELKDVEVSLRNALVSAQRFGDDVLDSAKREAHVIIEEARLKKAQAQLEVSRVPAALTRDIHILEQQRSRLRVEMMAILETHRKLLDSLVPEDAMNMPTSFFEAGVPEDRLDHDVGEVAQLNPPKSEPETEPETYVSPAESDEEIDEPPSAEAEPEPNSEDHPLEEVLEEVDEPIDEPPVVEMEPESDSEDHPLEGLEDAFDETPPVREDLEVDPGESLEDRIT